MKKIVLILLLLIPTCVFAQLGIGPAGNGQPLGPYPGFFSSDILGAPQTVATWQLRNAIPAYVRTQGQFCYVTGVDSLYILRGGTANSNWVSLVTGGSIMSIKREIPAGALNGTNTIFTLSHIPKLGSEDVFINGLLADSSDYSISGAVITTTTPPYSTDKITVNYNY